MAIPRVKATYSLDPETVKTLERLAEQWNVSKSEALRRAIRAAARTEPRAVSEPTDAFDRWAAAVSISESTAEAWARRVRAERRAFPRKREP